MRRTMSASLGFRRDNTPPSAHQTPVWLEILCDKSTRSVRSLGRQPAKTAPPHRSDHERRPLEAVDVSNIVRVFSSMRRRSGVMASALIGTLLSEVDDTSILRRRRTARHHYFLGAQAPTARKGVRPCRRLSRSDLVLWREPAACDVFSSGRFSRWSGLALNRAGGAEMTPSCHQPRGVGSKTLALGNQTLALQLPQSHTSGRTALAWAYQNPQVGADFGSS